MFTSVYEYYWKNDFIVITITIIISGYIMIIYDNRDMTEISINMFTQLSGSVGYDAQTPV